MNPLRPHPLFAWLATACVATALAACTAWSDVRGVATGVPQPAYELRGARLATLQAEALRLCPNGYEVTRSWQRYGQPSDTWWSRWVNQATDFNGIGDRSAYLAVLCKDGDAAGAAGHADAASAAPARTLPALVPVPEPVPMPTSSPPPVPVPDAVPSTAPTPAPPPPVAASAMAPVAASVPAAKASAAKASRKAAASAPAASASH